MSASIKSTRLPLMAQEMARFAAMVDLPSPEMELVTSMTRFVASVMV